MENENNNKTDWAKRDVGALWKREGKSQKYLSGYVKVDELGIERELKIVVFSNKNKKDNEKAPDYRIYISKPAENVTPTQTEVAQPKKVKPSVQKVVAVADVEEDVL
jgi:uncharacterized protein (DUF736 family)